MKYSNIYTSLKLVFSLFLLVLILFMLVYAFSNFSELSDTLPGVTEVSPANGSIEVVATIVGAFVGVIGLMVTSVLSWREDKRREKYFVGQMERQRLEIERLKLQLQVLQGEPNKSG